MSSEIIELKVGPTIRDPKQLENWSPAQIAKIDGPPRHSWDDPSGHDIQFGSLLGKSLRPLLRSRPFQFALIIPNFFIFFFAAISGFFGTNNASVSLATVLTWIVWWAFLLLMIAGLSRLWCVICPFGAMGEWAMRFTLWGTGGKRFSLNLNWPKKVKSIWLVNAFFIFFLWMDNVFGFGNSPVLTGYFIVVLVVLDVGVGLLFEKRSFCRYMCPINGFIGLQGLFAGFEMRSKSSAVCLQCRGKWCLTGREDVEGGYGCPMFLYPGGNDTNKYCILCTECLKSCPNNTMRLGIRPPLKDLWANKSFDFDESFNSMALIGVSSVAPLALIKYTKPISNWFLDRNIIGGVNAIRFTDIIVKTLLYVGGLFGAILLLMIIMKGVDAFIGGNKGAKHYINIYTGALLPLSLFKLIADISDHIVRNGSTVIYVVYNFVVDFPRGDPDAGIGTFGWKTRPVVAPVSLNDPVVIYIMQAGLLTLAFFSSLFVIYKLAVNWEPQKKFSSSSEAMKAAIVFMIISAALTYLNLWALSGPATL